MVKIIKDMKLFGLIELDFLLKLLMQAFVKFADSIVDGSKLNHKEKKYLRMGHYMNQEWGDYFAEQSDNTLDDEGVIQINNFCEKTADEGGFKEKLTYLEPLDDDEL